MKPATAFLFPGQGSQFVGRGRSLFEKEPVARARFEEADALLGCSLSKLCFNGPEEDLRQTQNQQPALFVCSVAACDALRERDIEPYCVAGHSLGEYAALYAAGVFDFETGLRLVAQRAQAMAEVGRNAPGAMAAVLGLDLEKVQSLCAEASASDGVVVVANDNSPGQTVISGAPAAVNRACDLARTAGARRVTPLPVSGAFHSPLVEPVRKTMESILASKKLNVPRCKYVANVTGLPESDPEAIRAALVRQITSRVRWVEAVRSIAALGVTAALEVGSGRVLAGLVKRIEEGISVQAAGTAEEIHALVEGKGN